MRLQSIPPSDQAIAVQLLAEVDAALERDPRRARLRLKQLASLIAAPPSSPDERAGTDDEGEIPRGGLAPWQIRRVTAHVDRHLDAPLTVADLAAVARLSSGHFCRAFKVATGKTPHAFVVERRIQRAQALMLSTDEPLSQVAAECGLTDQAHLTRLFRRHVGATPLSWRRIWRKAG